MRALCITLLFAPLFALAQTPVLDPTPLTLQLLMAQRPAGVTVGQWDKIIRNPANATAYPIHLSQAMLDTIDVKQLDMRYHYVMVPREQ